MKRGFYITVGLVYGFQVVIATAAETKNRASLERELKQVNTELSPYRIEARRTPEVQKVQKKLDDAYHEFYNALDKKVIELNPKMKSRVLRRQILREEIKKLDAASLAPKPTPTIKQSS